MIVLNYSLKNRSLNRYLFFYFVFFGLFANNNSFSQQKAFPSAYGAGAYTSGGRGGMVVHVTNLNDKGKGSLRDALLMTVPRTIVFDVSGVITLSSYIQMRAENSNVTIAGQTAPEGGITIDGNRLYLTNVDNIIVRYLRFRGGITAKGLGYNMNDSLSSLGDVTNQIFDHCSFSWDGDETASWYDDKTIDKVTVQRSIFGEGLKGSLFGGPERAKTGEMSFHHSLFYNTTHRTPNVSGFNGAKIETINNVVWTISHRLIQSNGNLQWNHIGNYYDYGIKPINNGVLHMHSAIDKNPPKIYTYGNKIVAINSNSSRGLTPVSELNSDNKKAHRYFQNAQGHVIGEQLRLNYFTDSRHPLLGNPIPIQSADNAFLSVQNDVGCNARLNEDGSVSDNKDVLDTRWLLNVKNGRYVERSDNSTWKVPHIKSVQRSNEFYVSNPHIPEAFFRTYVPKGQNHNDVSPSGYTWLEEYLNMVDNPEGSQFIQTVEVTPAISEIKLTETLQLNKTYKPNSPSNPKGQWKSSDEEIAKVDANGLVTPIKTGVVTITFQSTINGVEGKSELTVVSHALSANAGSDQEICRGESAVLSAKGGTYFVWSTGETSKTITVTPSVSTRYTLNVYDETKRNSDEDEVYVKVNPLPNVSAGKNISINSGEMTVLKATGANNYIWSTGDRGASISVNPSVTTTYSVTGESNGCEVSDSVKVIVNKESNPSVDQVSAGENQRICKRSSASLTATGGVFYEWSTGDRTANIDVFPLETTTYTVTAYDKSGAEIGSDDVRVEVSEIPNVSAGMNATINSGESTVLTASGANSYLWSTGETTASITVTPSSTSYYSVVGITKDGCENYSNVLVMIRNTVYYVDKYNGIVNYKRPMASNRATPIGGSSLGFSENGDIFSVVQPMARNINYGRIDNTELDGNHGLNHMNQNENAKKIVNKNLQEKLQVSSHLELNIYPNPTQGIVNIKVTGLANHFDISVYDLTGKSLFKDLNKDGGGVNYNKILNLSDYKSGVYFVKLVTKQETIVKKIILI